MRVGDYVRLGRCQGINRIEEYDEDIKRYKLEEIIADDYGDETFILDENDVIKSSPNIIDLLKKDDLAVDYNDDIYKVNKIYKGYVFTDKKNKYGQVITLVDYQIKYIVTKEQFSQMEYKVGE